MFYSRIFIYFNKDKYVLIQLRIKTDVSYFSLSKFQTVSYNDKQQLLDVLTTNLKLYYERYTHYDILDLFFRYTILQDSSPLNKSVLRHDKKVKASMDHLSKLNLPATLDLYKWGKVTKLNDSFYQISVDKLLYTVVITAHTRTVTVAIGSVIDRSFTDIVLNQSMDEFKRILDSGATVFYKNGDVVKITHPQKAVSFMKTLAKSANSKFDFVTLDLETRTIPFNYSDSAKGDIMEVISAAIYDGNNSFSFFINDYENSTVMMEALINFLFKEYAGKTIYVHNLSGFDGVFLLPLSLSY